MLEKINNRLDSAIANLDIESFDELFPLILNDLEYILVELSLDEEKLSPGDIYRNGVSIASKTQEYLAKLSTMYFKLLHNIDIEIINSNDYNLSIGGGGYNFDDGKIYYTYIGAMLSKNSDLSFLHTCLHEGRHKMQHEAYKTEDILSFSPCFLRLLKEHLLENSLQENNRKFYLDNYHKLFTENDAELFASYELENFIPKLMDYYLKKSNKKESDIDDELMYKISKLNHLFNENLKKEKFNIDDEVASQIYDSPIIKGKFKIKDEEKEKIIMMDKYIKSHPELQEKYPILRLLFNKDRPKTHKETIADLMRLKEGKSYEFKEKIDALYDEIIVTDPILLLNEMLLNEDVQSIEIFMNMYKELTIEYQEEIKELNEQYGCFNTYIR